jgi:RimJ/RimL family protein N-acetyltransferase
VEGLLLRAGAGQLTRPWPRAQLLTTARLTLEPLRVEHARELAPLLDDPALHAFTGGEPETEAQLRARYERQVAGHAPDGSAGWLNWVLRERATGAPVGTVQATVADGTAELAWIVVSARQGEGLATEAATAVAQWLRSRGIARLVAHIHPDHAASAAVARRLGMTPGEPRADGEVRWSG